MSRHFVTRDTSDYPSAAETVGQTVEDTGLSLADIADQIRHTLRRLRCAHPHCRTSLTEETAVFCRHRLAFCEACVFEEGCESCNHEAVAS